MCCKCLFWDVDATWSSHSHLRQVSLSLPVIPFYCLQWKCAKQSSSSFWLARICRINKRRRERLPAEQRLFYLLANHEMLDGKCANIRTKAKLAKDKSKWSEQQCKGCSSDRQHVKRRKADEKSRRHVQYSQWIFEKYPSLRRPSSCSINCVVNVKQKQLQLRKKGHIIPDDNKKQKITTRQFVTMRHVICFVLPVLSSIFGFVGE